MEVKVIIVGQMKEEKKSKQCNKFEFFFLLMGIKPMCQKLSSEHGTDKKKRSKAQSTSFISRHLNTRLQNKKDLETHQEC